ncbi:MAG: hypothetical protein KKE17_07910 [Proteobacteria bacterium]|nr:hypothetical protein [Pseudomonadota bacterium]MBU1709911.1 hypothetical protein [Pseudomonadota bacterium]
MFLSKRSTLNRAGSDQRFCLLFLAVALFLSLGVGGCASQKLRDARDEFHAGNVAGANQALAGMDDYPTRDRLLYHMERGTILFNLAAYEESVQEFLAASKLITEQEVISISRQTGSIVTSEWFTEYKGEYSERLWVHSYLMMNFLLLDQYEAALVEAKQALKLFAVFPDVLRKEYAARALIGSCYEFLLDYDDAYIEFKKLFDDMPQKKNLARHLYGLAWRLGYKDDFGVYTPYLSAADMEKVQKADSTELIVFVEIGRAPVKVASNIIVPPSIRFSWPKYTSSPTDYGMRVKNRDLEATGMTVSTDMGALLRSSLSARAEIMIVKEAARVGVKEVIAQAVGRENGELAGAAVRLLFFLTEEADTRGWETLPGGLALVRIPLLPGKHRIELDVFGGAGGSLGNIILPEFEIQKGQKIFKSVRWPVRKMPNNPPEKKKMDPQ